MCTNGNREQSLMKYGPAEATYPPHVENLQKRAVSKERMNLKVVTLIYRGNRRLVMAVSGDYSHLGFWEGLSYPNRPWRR